LQALFLTPDEPIRDVTGFQTPFFQSPTRPWFVIVPGAGKPIAVIPEIGAALMATTWIDDIRTWASPDPVDDGVSLLADALADRVPDPGRIGMPMGPETGLRMPLQDFERLRDQLGGRRFQDATEILKTARMKKSVLEIEKIAWVCGRASDAFADLPNRVVPGLPDTEIMRRFRIDCLMRGVDAVPYLVGGAGPDGTADVIAPPVGREICAGDILMLDTGCVYDGYFCDFDRNFAIGTASDAARRAYRTLHEAVDAGLSVARPGVTCADLFHAMQNRIGAAPDSGSDVGRMGHGLGMQLTEPPSLTPFDETPLVEGMVLTLEPSMSVVPGRIMVHEENIVIREDGCTLMTTRAPSELPVVA
ncbi:MAG: Xaa-Pro peptidase family protein, partial [Pseudomonadota bacterium]